MDERREAGWSFAAAKAEFYKTHRQRDPNLLKAKHVRQFNAEFLDLARAEPSMRVLEIGCGAGLFLRYLKHRGFADVVAVDYDENLKDALADVGGYDLRFGDARAVLAGLAGGRPFDRVVLFDVIEHMPLEAGVDLLRTVAGLLAPGAKILLRVPNAASPWGLGVQFGSFDHVTAFSPGRLRELSLMTGYRCATLVGQATGKRRRKAMQGLLHRLLAKVLTSPPEIWEENLLCVLEKD